MHAKMVICHKSMYRLHMTWWSNKSFVQLWCRKFGRVCTKAKRECVQKLSAPADECVAKHFLSGRGNQCDNGYNWRKSLVVGAYYVRNSCSLNLVSKGSVILSLLTTKGRKSYGFSPNFAYHRPCMIDSIVCKDKRIKLSDIFRNDTSGYHCSHRHMHLRYNNKKDDRITTHICTLIWGLAWDETSL